MKNLQAGIDYSDAVAEWLLDLSDLAAGRQDTEAAIRYCYVAASVLARQCRRLTSTRIEAKIQSLSRAFPPAMPKSVSPTKVGGARTRCLHVLNTALPAGGLTAMAVQWIRHDTRNRIHSVALLSQEHAVPDDLFQAVVNAGGSVHRSDHRNSFMARSEWLRQLAADEADVVVLHTGSFDLIAAVAFGGAGGPPVMLVNHTAHTFWVGTSIADRVLNCRGSVKEEHWTRVYRGVPRISTVPIPVEAPELRRDEPVVPSAKAKLGLPFDSVVLLTVGAGFKYLPLGDLDFVATIESILRQMPSCYLLVAGAAPDHRWAIAAKRLCGRIRLVGKVSRADLDVLHRASDVYVEGFPFGTTTALLEAGAKGIPAVLAPLDTPPPFGTDGLAVDGVLHRPQSVQHYIGLIRDLCSDAEQRKRIGAALRLAVLAHHTGSGWQHHTDQAFAALPTEHRIYPQAVETRTPAHVHELWARFVDTWNERLGTTLQLAISDALRLGLRPSVSPAVLGAFRRFAEAQGPNLLHHAAVCMGTGAVVSRLPAAQVAWIFRFVDLCFEPASLSRRVGKVLRKASGGSDPRKWYSEYAPKKSAGRAP